MRKDYEAELEELEAVNLELKEQLDAPSHMIPEEDYEDEVDHDV